MAEVTKELPVHIEKHERGSSDGSLRRDEESPATGTEDWSPEEEKKLVYVSHLIRNHH